MSPDLERLFDRFDRGRLSRRQLLTALGLAVAVRPAATLAQGQGGAASAQKLDTTPAPAPFESTGWRTVLLDHFSCKVADHPKEAAYYNALMNWKIRSDNGNEAMLDIGDWGSLILRGGYHAPPPTEEQKAMAARAAQRGLPPRGPVNALFDNFCWGIEPWDAKKVETELRKRGLTPVAENHGSFESFHVKDPDGFDLQISNGNGQNRRRTPANGKTSAPAPFEHTGWKTIWLDHISYEVSDYKKSVAFYEALLGWKGTGDNGRQNQCQIGDVGDVIIRRAFRGGPNADPTRPLPPGATIGHIAFGITPFDPDEVKAALEKRGLRAQVDTGGKIDIHQAPYKSYHTTTPNGFDLQISNTTKANREPLTT